MKRFALIFTVAVVVIAASSRNTMGQSQTTPQNLQEAGLTHVLTLGGKDDLNRGDHLLAEPRFLDVTYDNSDIIVIDEDIFKVYDENGIPKTIIGRIGEGSGEYSEGSRFYVSPNGYITVLSGGEYGVTSYSHYDCIKVTGLNCMYSIFTPEYGFIDTKRLARESPLDEYFNNQGFNLRLISGFYALNKDKLIYGLTLTRENETDPSVKGYHVLVLQDNDTYRTILQLKIVTLPEVSFSLTDLQNANYRNTIGKLHWELLQDGNIVYVNTMEDEVNEQGNSFYTVNVIDLSGNNIMELKHPFQLKNLPESYFVERKSPSRNPRIVASIAEREKVKVLLAKEHKYYTSTMTIKVDGDYLFVFPNGQPRSNISEDEGPNFADVFNLSSGMYVKTIKLPFIPMAIRNGCIYEKNRDDDGFTIFNKYKLDPAVYGK